jgi:SulP family sulfate permease
MQASPAGRKNLVADLVAGLTTGISNIPDAMAMATLAGTTPVNGLYALMVGTPVGALVGSSVFMNIGITSAMALATASAVASDPSQSPVSVIITLTLLVGIFQILAGLLKMGRLMRFVSNAVMVGFLTGVSVSIILGQIPDLTGGKHTL